MGKAQLYNNNSGGLFITSSTGFVEVPGTRCVYDTQDGGDILISVTFTCASPAIISFAHTLISDNSSGSLIPFNYGSGIETASPNPITVTYSYKTRTAAGDRISFSLGVKVFSGALIVSIADPPQITVVEEI